jgi:TonB-linked SusC/RagA family outer membrane protein
MKFLRMRMAVLFYSTANYPLKSKAILVMNLTSILLFFACLQVSASGFSQQITISEKNAPLKKVLHEIRKQSGYRLLYNTDLIEKANRVTLDVKRVNLEDVLLQSLKGQPFTFELSGNVILIKPKAEQFIFPKELSEKIIPPITVKGKVTDSKGEALIGVGVRVKNSNTGTSTNVDGTFTLANIADDATLIFTYIGYITKEVPVDRNESLTIQLTEDATKLSEVVVTAFGVAREKRGLVTSTQEVKGDRFTQARDNNIASALSGRLAGVDATQINSGPGASSRVIIRGNTSLNSNQQPLYVVNGLPIRNDNNGASQNSGGFNADRGDGISMMNPDDIESITVLKGGAAATLYGSQAANGVILITTKSGKAQKGIGVELNSVANYGTPSVFPVYQYEYGQGQAGKKPATLAEAQATGRLSFGTKIDGVPYIQVDGKMHPYEAHTVKENIHNFLQPSSDITNTLAFAGGNQTFNARLSVSDLRSNAQQPESKYKRQGANLNMLARLGKNDFITIKSSMQYNIVKGINRPTVGYAVQNAAWPAYLIANTVDIRSLAPGYDPITGNELKWQSAIEATNPYYLVNKDGNGDNTQRFLGSASIQVNLKPNLYLLAQGSKDFQFYDQFNYLGKGTNEPPFGNLSTTNGNREKSTVQATINYNAKFLRDFSVSAMAGGYKERNASLASSVSGSVFIIPDFISYTNLKNLTPANRLEIRDGTNALFAQADFDFKKILYLSLTGRNDWFSTLNPGNNSIFYPSIGTSFILSDAIKMPAKVDFVKLRASWAQVGSATVSAGSVVQTYTLSSANSYNVPVQGVLPTLQNPNLRPLTVTTVEGGFETQFLRNRLALDVTYYKKITTDDIVSVNISATSGFSGGNQNIGKLTNNGVEIVLGGSPIRKQNFSWDASLNYSWNKSKIISLAPNVASITLGTGILGSSVVNRLGLPYGTLMAIRMKKDANGQFIYNSTSNFPIGEEVPFGVGTPSTLVGLSNTFRYKRFSLDVLVDGKFGAVGYNNLMVYATRFGLTPMTLEGRESGLRLQGVNQDGKPYNYLWSPTDVYQYYNNLGRGFSGLFVYNTDFVKLRRAVLSYNFSVEKLRFVKLQSASISIVSSNLLTLYRDKAVKAAGLDPEFQESTTNAQGTGGVNLPQTRNIGLNLNLKF